MSPLCLRDMPLGFVGVKSSKGFEDDESRRATANGDDVGDVVNANGLDDDDSVRIAAVCVVGLTTTTPVSGPVNYIVRWLTWSDMLVE